MFTGEELASLVGELPEVASEEKSSLVKRCFHW
jgi:hypothetical protein